MTFWQPSRQVSKWDIRAPLETIPGDPEIDFFLPLVSDQINLLWKGSLPTF
jgi:hypothetical protein